MNNYLKLYIKSIIDLARSIRIKSETTSDAINRALTIGGYDVDVTNPYTWKYYLNLSGEYHPTDKMIQITSHDTYQIIDFTKENLQVHLLTAKNYRVGTEYFKELVRLHPEQSMLIQGISSPIDIDEAINAKDHTILTYEKSLVESNESYLMPAIRTYVDNFFGTRHNPDYSLMDEYYYIKLLSGLSTKLVLEIIRLRHEQCLTNKAHSFHMRMFLLSFSNIGEEFHYLTFNQRVWLYKNIRYLIRNIGKEETFKIITARLLTDKGFSLVGYDLSKSIRGLLDTLTPEIELTQLQINHIPPAAGAGNKDVRMIYAKEMNAAKGNKDIIEEHIEDTEEVAKTSRYGRVPTKVLESNVIDRTNSDPFTMSEITLNHWLYLSQTQRYNAAVQVTNPATGDRYNLNMKDAFILYLYTYNKALGIDLLHVPNLLANRVIRDPLPDIHELRLYADKELIPDYYLRHILNTQPTIGVYMSTETFREFCGEIWELLFRHRELRFFATDYRKEGQLHTLVDRCYMDVKINLANEMPYDEWLALKGISLPDASSLDLMTIASEILTYCTGEDLQDTTSMRETHLAMLRLMRTLSSYSVQYLAEINDSAIKVIDGKIPAMSDSTYTESLKFIYDMYTPTTLANRVKMRDKRNVDVPLKVLGVTFPTSIIDVDIPTNIDILGGTSFVNKAVIVDNFLNAAIAPLPDEVLEPYVSTNNPTLLPPRATNTFQSVLEGYALTPERLAELING